MVENEKENELMSGSGDRTIKIWDLKTGSLKRTIKSHTDAVLPLVFNEKTNELMSGSKDNTIKIWYMNSGEM